MRTARLYTAAAERSPSRKIARVTRLVVGALAAAAPLAAQATPRDSLVERLRHAEAAIAALKHTPGAAFGSCRYKLASIHEHRSQYERLIEVFRAHDIEFFFYNGGGDSQDTAYKVSQIGAALAYPIVCVGIPKAVDNVTCPSLTVHQALAQRRNTSPPV